ncbi:MAG: DUF1846 domain-containing protein [Oscillospiraceae bacterium]|jgi:uncharacterized protein (UPF0371 family)|nr:DUF1846 domain-containing protein [Oscillospiraceae bacterium]
MYAVGFDVDQYLERQSKKILERIGMFENKLYLEFGGKLYNDYHAARILPGYIPDIKIQLLKTLAEKVEIVIVVNASNIDNSKEIGDTGVSYGDDVLRLVDEIRKDNLYVGSVVISQYLGQPAATTFKEHLESLDINVYRMHYIPDSDYPSNVQLILSEQGYGNNDYIETTRPLVVVTAPGPACGKMATCLSQLYHENERGVKAGYAKFETFPVWNLPLKHMVNLAYEAATADLNDVNMIDPFHLEAYNVSAVSYNRDIEVFPILNAMFTRIWGESPYRSPTDMGVNMIGFCINDEICADASRQEIIRRFFNTQLDYARGKVPKSALSKLELIMNSAEILPEERPPVKPALKKAEETGTPCVAIELPDGTVIAGKTSSLLGASSATLLNVLKHLAGIDDKALLISPSEIEPIQKLKVGYLGYDNPTLHTDEVLLALAINAATNETAELVLRQIPKISKSEAHSSVILPQVDIAMFKQLGVNITCEPVFQNKRLFQKR